MRLSLSLLVVAPFALAASLGGQNSLEDDLFRQLDELLPTPNSFRTASGAPGSEYWQQRVDYEIAVELDDETKHLKGDERITYWNQSPDRLDYLWLQLDQNRFRPDSDGNLVRTAPDFDRFGYRTLKGMLARENFEGGFEIESVRDESGGALQHTIVKTMMRIDLPTALEPGDVFVFHVTWNNYIPETRVIGARGGYEWYEEDENAVYGITQWFPRLAAYTDYAGWQHKQFLGSGEFTLEFGNYDVTITVPADHIVSATGDLVNPDAVLTETQLERLEQARSSAEPVFIVTPEEALENQAEGTDETKTWRFLAENVRDFAWASSRKFIWDALEVDVLGKPVMCMSLYPNEGEPLWSRYSTHSIAHTLDVYSKHTFQYPYPVAISVCGPVGGGMEYPMICFNGPRPEDDGTYSKRTKYFLIGVIIHEVGHNYFPMIVNSDERQWTWMDEGLNTYLQYLTEQEWEEDFPSGEGEPKDITGYMASTRQVPIMTNSESLLQFGNNAYSKPATALNILRETIVGRELFDFAFRTYSQRWMFKRPEPADFFRSLEDASGVDLDWFFRGWFYTTDHVDVGITGIEHFALDTRDPDVDKRARREEREGEPETVSRRLNRDLPKYADRFPDLYDFYNEFDELDVTAADRRDFEQLVEKLEDDEKELLGFERQFYVVGFENLGGLVTPLVIEAEWADGTVEEIRVPAEVWRRSTDSVAKLLMGNSELVRVQLDPHLETADTDTSNNVWPPEPELTRFQLFKRGKSKNPMQKAEAEAKRAVEASAPVDDEDDDSEESEDGE